jgi:hypothetical protein
LARTNYQHGKRLRELAKKQKREEKEKRRKERKEGGGLMNIGAEEGAEAPLEEAGEGGEPANEPAAPVKPD